MMERELYYDINENRWVLFDNPLIIGKEIEDVPIVIVMAYDGDKYIWCKNHTRFEKVLEVNEVNWHTESCEINGIPAYFSYKDADPHAPYAFNGFHAHYYTYAHCEFMKIPIRWKLKTYDEKQTLVLGVDVCEILIGLSNDPPIHRRFRIRRYMYGNSTYGLNNEDVYYFQEKIPYPSEITDNAIEMLREMAKNIYGIKPANTEHKMTGETYIKAFLFRPYDLNCYFLKGYIDMISVPKDCKNAYHIICEQLETTPPKGLKKLYHYNPFVVPMYRVLVELGFKDYNLMRPFFHGTKIGDIDFSACGKHEFPFWDNDEQDEEGKEYISHKSVYTRNDDMISQEEIDALLCGGIVGTYLQRREYTAWKKLKFFVSWFMEVKGELRTAKRLYKYTTEESQHRWQCDICDMIYQYFDNLSNEIKDNFLSHGCTRVIHDNLVYEINHFDYVREELTYPIYTEDLECEINGFRFELPRYTDELADIGREMHNCVASYISNTKHHDCTIIVVRKDNRCVACIEVDKNGKSINQALGINNERLTGDIRVAVILWAKKMLLFDELFELNMDEFTLPDGQNVEYRNVENKTSYFLYTIKELLSLAKEERGRGFYRALATKVITQQVYKERYILLPTLNEIPNKDERAYIHKVCPSLDCVIEDAMDGIGEAQMVMYELYRQYLPFNLARENFWYMKSRFISYAFPELFRGVYDENNDEK